MAVVSVEPEQHTTPLDKVTYCRMTRLHAHHFSDTTLSEIAMHVTDGAVFLAWLGWLALGWGVWMVLGLILETRLRLTCLGLGQ